MIPMGLFAPIQVLAATDEKLPAASRELAYDVEVFAKYTYNETDLASVRDGSGIKEGSYLIPFATVTQQDNETLDATFTHNRGYMADANIGDLNITGGTSYSSDIFGDVGTLPRNYVFPSTARANFQTLGVLDETALPDFDKDQELQYFIRESPALDEVELDIAQSLKRTWTASNISITSVEIILTFEWSALESLFIAMKAHEDWDEDDPMSTGELVSVLDDVLPAYTFGWHLGMVNITDLRENADKANWEGTDEIVATLANDTDATLSSFSKSWHMTNAMLSYFGENADAITAAVNNKNWGQVLAPARGMFKNLVATGETAEGEGTVAVAFAPAATFAVGGDMVDSALTFVETLEARLVEIITSVPYFGIIVTAFFLYLLVLLVTGEFSEKKIKAKFEEGKKLSAGKVATQLIILGALIYLVYAVVA